MADPIFAQLLEREAKMTAKIHPPELKGKRISALFVISPDDGLLREGSSVEYSRGG
jgi:hypothetical protein